MNIHAWPTPALCAHAADRVECRGYGRTLAMSRGLSAAVNSTSRMADRRIPARLVITAGLSAIGAVVAALTLRPSPTAQAQPAAAGHHLQRRNRATCADKP